MAEFASRGVGNAGLTTGIIGTSLGALAALGGLAGVGMRNADGGQPYGSNGSPYVTRFDLEQAQRIADLESQNALKDATILLNNNSLELYKYIDGKFVEVEKALAVQEVRNQRTEDSFALVSENVKAVKNDLIARIKLEAERRSCGDNAIVNYSNATFYPKMVADITTGSTTTAQTLYNPIPTCDCNE
jgi:hypothetical protein